MIKQLIHLITLLLPFLKREESMKAIEFTELVKNQYNYLMVIIEKFQKDYFDMLEQLKEMNLEIITLNSQLQQALELKCREFNCADRH